MICVRVPNWLSHNLSPFHLTTSHSIFSLHKSDLFYHFVASQSQPWAPQFLVHDELRQPRTNERPFRPHSPTLSEAHPHCLRPHNSVASDKLATIDSSHDRINSIALIYGSNIASFILQQVFVWIVSFPNRVEPPSGIHSPFITSSYLPLLSRIAVIIIDTV